MWVWFSLEIMNTKHLKYFIYKINFITNYFAIILLVGYFLPKLLVSKLVLLPWHQMPPPNEGELLPENDYRSNQLPGTDPPNTLLPMAMRSFQVTWSFLQQSMDNVTTRFCNHMSPKIFHHDLLYLSISHNPLIVIL